MIKFSTFPSLNNGSLGANAGFSHIIFSLEWAAYLVLKNDKTVWNAFLCSIGHELTHRDGNDINSFLHPINIRFIAWANEVHADFESENKMLGQSRSRLIAAMKFKYSQKEQDQDSCSHPSWKRRIHYAENFETFDEKLIRQIAKDARLQKRKTRYRRSLTIIRNDVHSPPGMGGVFFGSRFSYHIKYIQCIF